MCDQPPRPVRAARAVSVRDLGRSTASIVGEVELDGSVVVLSRRGRMVALLTPLPERTIIEITSEARQIEDEPEEDVPSQPVDLEPLEIDMLGDARADYPMPFSMASFVEKHACTASAAAIAFTSLELEGLVENGVRGRRLTRKGLAAARWLDSADARPS